MSERNEAEQHGGTGEAAEYERPTVEEIETHDGPAVTAAGGTSEPK